MIYSARIYTNTGFNSINVPDSPALLNSMSHVDLPVLDLNQERFLPYVNLKTTWDAVKNADYCKVGDFFYFIANISMTSADVAQVTLTPDFITSAGGFGALEILGGMTSRVHVANDAFGLYGEEDPYMSPAYDMDIMSDTTSGDFSGGEPRTFVETTLDLEELGVMYQGSKSQRAITAVDPERGDDYFVTYPVVESLQKKTKYYASIGTSGLATELRSVDGQGLYQTEKGYGKDQQIKDGIAMARSLGIEQSISGKFSIPSRFVSGGLNGGFVGAQIGLGGRVALSNLPFIYGSANNNRVFYGSQSPYYICSCAGNTLSAKAEEISIAGRVCPFVVYTADPRRTGKPYFRFDPMNGVEGNGNVDFFRNCVAGTQWQTVPMVLTEKSGSTIDMLNFQASQAVRQQAIDQAALNLALGKMGNMAKTAYDFIDFGKTADGGSYTTFSNGAIIRGAAAEFTMEHLYDQFIQRQAMQKAIETQQFQISQNVVTPTVMFGGTPDLMSEVLGNGFLAYRAIYKDADIARIDKILTAFGYKYTKVLESSDFSNRRYFNYVEGSISVGNLPKWWADGIAMQLAGGVRIWHVKPNHSYYSNNPV